MLSTLQQISSGPAPAAQRQWSPLTRHELTTRPQSVASATAPPKSAVRDHHAPIRQVADLNRIHRPHPESLPDEHQARRQIRHRNPALAVPAQPRRRKSPVPPNRSAAQAAPGNLAPAARLMPQTCSGAVEPVGPEPLPRPIPKTPDEPPPYSLVQLSIAQLTGQPATQKSRPHAAPPSKDSRDS